MSFRAPLRGNQGSNVPKDSGSVQRGDDLRDRLNARRAEALKRVDTAISTAEVKAIMEGLASLDEKLTGGVEKDMKC